MFKILKKYTNKLWIVIDINDISYLNNYLLFLIDEFLFWHNEHLKIRKIILKETQENIQDLENKQKLITLGKKQLFINNNIISFFSLIIIELSKDFENENSLYKEKIYNFIIINKYKRIRRWKYLEVNNIIDLITHYRDAICHNKILWISYSAELKEKLDLNNAHHLKFIIYYKDNSWCFKIWDWIIKYDEFKKILLIILQIELRQEINFSNFIKNL